MNRILRTLLGSCLVCVLTSAPAWAQAIAQISGTARDQSGGVLPGVAVTVTQTDTGIEMAKGLLASGLEKLAA